MKFAALIILFFVNLALSGPARRGCGEEKCYDAVNECGMTYGGCWTECAGGLTQMPTFTAPLCDSTNGAELSTQSREVATEVPSTTGGPPTSLITPPPSLETTPTPSSSSCSALWLCVDYLAVCGDLTQMYGGCYDVCTSAPPVTSPPCSLSSSNTESEYAAPSSLTDSAYAIPSSTSNANPTSSPEPGAAYTEKSASDSIAPALDDSKALVMAEMPKADSSVPNSPAASPAVEFRLANANAEGAAVESSNLVEAPANMREAALAKVMANNNRKPKTDNVPCWDKPWCKEVQLGIPSPTSSQASAEPSITSTEEPSSSTAANTPVSTIVDAAAPASTEAPA